MSLINLDVFPQALSSLLGAMMFQIIQNDLGWFGSFFMVAVLTILGKISLESIDFLTNIPIFGPNSTFIDDFLSVGHRFDEN